jgi:predicted ribonuclease YlaK
MQQMSHSSPPVEDQVRTYSVPGMRLDVAVVDYLTEGRKDFSITDLEEMIRKHWEMGDQRPEVITNSEKYHLKYRGRGMNVQSPRFLQVSADIANEGVINGSEELHAKLHENDREVSIEDAVRIIERELYLNQFVRFMDPTQEKYEYARVSGDLIRSKNGSRIVDVANVKLRLLDRREHKMEITMGSERRDKVLGISPRDMDQYLALQYGLFNPDIEIFFLCGSQGSGKTLLSYVAAVDLILHYDKEFAIRRMGEARASKGGFYKNLVLLKPNEIMGGKRRDTGFLPGTLFEKLEPHLGPYIDAHRESVLGGIFPFEDMILHPKFPNRYGGPRSTAARNKIVGQAYLPPNIEAVEMSFSGFMRGRSFTNTLILIDEAQNFLPYELKTILERAGEGCKVIVMGDPAQTDNPFCSREINGLTHGIRHYLGKPYCGLLRLGKNYRGQVSEDALAWKVYSS